MILMSEKNETTDWILIMMIEIKILYLKYFIYSAAKMHSPFINRKLGFNANDDYISGNE